ncbi:MAG: 2OG-Fe(II) oxygenase, partial [Gammaproteobacteria bacterium]|nr:2OG-Fe(II) oxygenase [Gammaproteobacteria bacterium]
MKELTSLKEVKPNSFIFEKENALPDFLCDDMVQRFEQAKEEQYKGRIGQVFTEETSIKKSTDLVVSGKDHWKDVD